MSSGSKRQRHPFAHICTPIKRGLRLDGEFIVVYDNVSGIRQRSGT